MQQPEHFPEERFSRDTKIEQFKRVFDSLNNRIVDRDQVNDAFNLFKKLGVKTVGDLQHLSISNWENFNTRFRDFLVYILWLARLPWNSKDKETSGIQIRNAVLKQQAENAFRFGRHGTREQFEDILRGLNMKERQELYAGIYYQSGAPAPPAPPAPIVDLDRLILQEKKREKEKEKENEELVDWEAEIEDWRKTRNIQREKEKKDTKEKEQNKWLESEEDIEWDSPSDVDENIEYTYHPKKTAGSIRKR